VAGTHVEKALRRRSLSQEEVELANHLGGTVTEPLEGLPGAWIDGEPQAAAKDHL
jgi:hypothetical protein